MAIHNIKAVIALGTSVYKNTITQKEISILQLFKRLSVPNIQPKKDGKYFIFASFKQNVRNAKNLDQFYGATIDLDDTSLTLAQIQKTFSKYVHCIYTTFSHKEKGKGDRYRLVLPYKKPVDITTHVETMLYLMDMLGATNVDLSSKALSRPMYLPAVPSKRERHFRFIKHTSGFFFNPLSTKIRDDISKLKFEQSDSLLQTEAEPFDINQDVEEGERNDSLARAVGKMIKTGVANADLYGLAESWNQTKLSPPLTTKEVKTITDSIVKSHTRNHGDLKWGFDEIISRITKSKNIASDYDHIVEIIAVAKSTGEIKASQTQLIVNKLNDKAKVGKRNITSDITSKELERAGKLEDENDDSFESTTRALKDDFKEWVYVASDDRVYNVRTGEYYKREAFAAMFATPNIEGSLFGIIMKYNLLKKVSRLEFDPSKDELFIRDNIRYANTYIAPEIFPLPGKVSVVIEHFKYLLPDKYERNIILDFIAHLIQHPGEKIRWMPIIKGGKGIGKTIIAETIIMPLIGFTNFGKVSNDVIKSDFNAWQLDKQLVVFEELDIGSNRKEKEQLTDSLKSFITDNILTAHRKGLDPYDTINKCNALGFTNKEDPIIITQDERRFCMIRTTAKPKSDSYYVQLAKFASENMPALYYYFLERNISKFSPLRAPETSYTKELKTLSIGWPGSIIHGWLHNDKHDISKAGCASFHQIIDHIKSESTGRYRTSAEDLQNVGSAAAKNLHYTLRNFGFARYNNPNMADGRMKVSGKLRHVWILPDYVDELEPMVPNMISKRLKTIRNVDENWAEE